MKNALNLVHRDQLNDKISNYYDSVMEYLVAVFKTAFIDKNLVSLVILKDNSEMVNSAMMRPVATCYLSLS